MIERSISRFFFKAELVLFSVPLSLVCAVAVAVALFDVPYMPSWETICLALLVSFATAAMVAGWILSIRFLRKGGSALVDSHWVWWALCSLGALIAFAALISTFVMPSERLTRLWYFRNTCSPLALGLVLLIPLAHLLIERFRYGR